MSETRYLKCPCHHCGGPIEFPATGVGVTVACPHCGDKTVLFAPPLREETPVELNPAHAIPPEPEPVHAVETRRPSPAITAPAPAYRPEPRERRVPTRAALILVVVVLLSTPAILYFARDYLRSRGQKSESVSSETVAVNNPGAVVQNPIGAATSGTTSKPGLAAKSLADLKVGSIQLEKARGSSLVYAVGILRNDSEHQRFGVNVELELSNTAGQSVGVARDYRAVIEPRQEWRFRALVLDTKAASAKVKRISEDQ